MPTKKKAPKKKRDRGRTFLLDQIPDDPWIAAKERAESEGRSMRWVILRYVEHYAAGADLPLTTVKK